MANPDIQQQLDQLTASVSQLAKVATANSDRISATDGRLDKLTTAVDALVVEFIRPAIQQTNANREAIAQLIERSDRMIEVQERYQEWLDEDRHDINTLRADTSQQITALIEQANADRKAADERFDAMQAEIRQNQRLILAQGERLDQQSQRNETLLAEVLSLSRRVTVVEETVEGNAA